MSRLTLVIVVGVVVACAVVAYAAGTAHGPTTLKAHAVAEPSQATVFLHDVYVHAAAATATGGYTFLLYGDTQPHVTVQTSNAAIANIMILGCLTKANMNIDAVKAGLSRGSYSWGGDTYIAQDARFIVP